MSRSAEPFDTARLQPFMETTMQFSHHVIRQPIRYSVATRFGGTNVVMTHRVADLGLQAVGIAVEAIACFDDFCRLASQPNNHEIGVIEIEQHAVIFEITRPDQQPQSQGLANRLVRLARADELDNSPSQSPPLNS
jgi:hypothetical protein